MSLVEDYRFAEVDKRLFALSALTRPGSVRDSVWRAEEFVRQALESGEFTSGSRVFVAGLGPVGMTVVLGLIASDINVVAFDLPPIPAESAFQNSLCRWVCPRMNDFPAKHWSDESRAYPIDDRLPVLPWSAGIARDVHNRMLRQFERDVQKKRAASIFQPRSGCAISGVEFSLDRIKVITRGAVGEEEHDVNRMILCAGFGRHVDFLSPIDGFQSHGFWSNLDPLFERGQHAGPTTVAMLGGQDGGLGDFVRLVTGEPDPRRLLERLPLSPAQLEECRALNREMWLGFASGGPERDHELFMDLQVRFLKFVSGLLAEDPRIVGEIDDMLLADDVRPRVQVVTPCWHFGQSFFSNRLLGLLLASRLAARPLGANNGWLPIRFGCMAVSCRGLDGHVCKRDASHCATARHEVTFRRAACGGAPATLREALASRLDAVSLAFLNSIASDDLTPLQADRVLCRFGAQGSSSRMGSQLGDAVRKRIAQGGLRRVPPFYTGSPAEPQPTITRPS